MLNDRTDPRTKLPAHPDEPGRRDLALARLAALAMFILCCWGVTHRYKGLGYDAQLYAFQALARIHPTLNLDLFLANNSQDRYTLFSPFYAHVIQWLGIEKAALVLLVVSTTSLLVGAWHLMRRLTDQRQAWLAVAVLVITPGSFGAFSVIRYSEDFFTARTTAEALVVIALALGLGQRRIAAGIVVAVAMLIHPIMALPGLSMLVCLWLPLRLCAWAALTGTLGALALALVATNIPAVAHWFPLINGDWLYVVRERSQYLLIDLWTLNDWKLNARPFATLLLTALAVPEPRVRRIALAAMLVGLTGLLVAAIGCLIGPVAILVQTQPWRLVWITTFFAVLLLPTTVMAVLREPHGGLLCAAFAMLAWTYPILDPLLAASLAVVLWALRGRFSEREHRWLHGLGIAILGIAALWMIGNIWTTVGKPFDTRRDPVLLQTVRNVLALQTPMMLLVVAFWWEAHRQHAAKALWVSAVALSGLAAILIPSAFKQATPLAAAYQRGEFDDWKRIIPEDQSVVLANQDASSLFVWFVLGRTNYLSESQSAGVVFSRDTALEVKRRSDRLTQLIEPNWKIQSAIAQYEKDPKKYKLPAVHPLTPTILVSVCADPKLGFLIAKEDVGFGALQHAGKGAWHNWNLYDCTLVRERGAGHANPG